MKTVSIIIASCNMFQAMPHCLDALRRFIPQDKREIIVVDNGSNPEMVRWLRNQQDIQLLANPANRGLAAAWNQGAAVAKGELLMFMHNDVFLSADAFSIMEECLAADVRLGAVVPWTNRCNSFFQHVSGVPYKDIEGMWAFAKQFSAENGGMRHLMLLDDVCILMRRSIFNEIGCFDEEFQASGYESYDYGTRILKQGYGLACTSAYVHHEPGSYGENRWNREVLMDGNRRYFQQKWGFVADYSMMVREDILPMIDWQKESLCVLDIGCSCGGNLMTIKMKHPNAELYGIELNPGAASVANAFGHVMAMDAEKIDEPGWQGKFDHVIMADVLEHLNNPWQSVGNIRMLLKEGGALLASLPNVQHISNVMNLLHGFWHYEDAGILDRTHLRFFTRCSIEEMMKQAGFREVKLISKQIPLVAAQEDYLRLLLDQPRLRISEENLRTYQWLVVAKR